MRRGPLTAVVCAVLTAAVAAGVVTDGSAIPGWPRRGDVAVDGEHPGGGGTEDGIVGEADDRLAKALEPVAGTADGRLSVAVQDLGSGVSGVYGGEPFDTASIVKVDILAALLLQAQDEGRQLTDRERAQAAAMIGKSDNDTTSALWRTIGGQGGLDRANARLGLIDTRGGQGRTWGLTQTTAQDQLTLLRAIYPDGAEESGPVGAVPGTAAAPEADGRGSPLAPASRAYLRELMGHIARGQDWGVSAAAEEGRFQLKNGWLPRSTTDLWEVNSIGQVHAGGHDYLVVVLSDGHPELDTGIAQVERAARTAVGAVRAAANGG